MNPGARLGKAHSWLTAAAPAPRRQTGHAGLEHEQRAGQRLARERRGVEPLARAGDVELGKSRPAERAACGPAHRHRHEAIEPAVGRETREAMAVPARAPEEAFGID